MTHEIIARKVVGSGIGVTLFSDGHMEVSVNKNAATEDRHGNYVARCNPSQAEGFFQWAANLKELR